MKTLLIASAMIFLVGTTQAQVNNVDVTCSYEIDGNDASRRFGGFKELKESALFRQFQLGSMQGDRMYLNFDRIVPHADNACLYRNYQIVMLRGDQSSISKFEERGIPYAKQSLKSNAAIRIYYGGPNEPGGDQLTLAVRGPGQGQLLSIDGERRRQLQARYEFDRNGKAEFDIEFKIHFQYADLGGDGVASFFTGSDCDLSSEDIVNAERDTFSSEVKVSCEAFLNEVSNDTPRDIGEDLGAREPRLPTPVAQPTGPATGFSEDQIIRPQAGQQ